MAIKVPPGGDVRENGGDTSQRERLEREISKLCKYIGRSPWAFHVNSGSCNGCDIEIIAALTPPRYDAERFGVKLVGTPPRHADVLLVTGPPVTNQSLERVKLIYEQTPDPKVVVAVGACPPTGGSVFYESPPFTNAPLDRHIPVDVFVPGCRRGRRPYCTVSCSLFGS